MRQRDHVQDQVVKPKRDVAPLYVLRVFAIIVDHVWLNGQHRRAYRAGPDDWYNWSETINTTLKLYAINWSETINTILKLQLCKQLTR